MSYAQHVGKIMFSGYGDSSSFQFLIAEYGELDELALKSARSVVASLQPVGCEDFAANYTSLEDAKTDTGTPKYGHRIENAQRQTLYEAKMTKFTLTAPFGFDFIDHVHATVTPHLVGHTEKSDWGNSLLLDSNASFTLDGEDVWKHLKRNGVRVETSFQDGSIWSRYRIFRDDREIAVFEQSSMYVHEEDAAQHGKLANLVPAVGFYRIWTKEENLDLLFVTILAFARSGANNDEGGSYGLQMRNALGRKTQ